MKGKHEGINIIPEFFVTIFKKMDKLYNHVYILIHFCDSKFSIHYRQKKV
jgi:hypothetical protein